MATLEDLKVGAAIRGILPDQSVTISSIQWYGGTALELTYKDATGRLGSTILYRSSEPELEVVHAGRPWSFDADGARLRLVSEAQRIRLAHLFDPLLAVHTSDIEPLPHQLTAVYGEMLTRQPLRFLLADDPGAGKTISQRMLFVELDEAGTQRHANYAPYLDYRPLCADEPAVEDFLALPQFAWIGVDLERRAQEYAIVHIVPEHLDEVKTRQLAYVAKARTAVRERLFKEISHWDHRAQELRLQEFAGKTNARLNSQEASRRAEEMTARLERRMQQLKLEEQISALPPVVLGASLVVPLGLVQRMTGKPVAANHPIETQLSAAAARAAVMAVERRLGFSPTDVETQKLGYDVLSGDAKGAQRFIEVKGRVAGADTITVTKNEILTSFNEPEKFILAMVEFLPGGGQRVRYLRQPFHTKPDFDAASVNYDFDALLARAGEPN